MLPLYCKTKTKKNSSLLHEFWIFIRNEVRPANGVAAEWGTGTEQDLALASEVVGNMILEVGLT